MKVALVARGVENIGLEYLSAALKNKGHSVHLIFDPSLFKSFYFYNKFLAKCFNYKDIIIDEIKNINPDLVGFSVLSDDFSWALSLSSFIKTRKNIPVIFGGLHPTLVPELVIKHDEVDYICIGEGEEAIGELADSLEHNDDGSHINNIWAKRNGRIVNNPIRRLNEKLDNLPFPDKDIFYQQYPVFVRQSYKIITSRGCPNACSYCYNSYLKKIYANNGKYLRRRSVDNVISELIIAKQKYKSKIITFLDDTFVCDDDWLNEFAEKYRKAISLPFFCTIHPSFVNKKNVRLLKMSGCKVVNMGVQDLSEVIRGKILNRNDNNIDIKRAIRLIKKSGIFIYTTVILGLPTQREKELRDTIITLNEYRPDVADSNWLRYYPKTSILESAVEHNILTRDDIERINNSYEFKPYGLGGHSFSVKVLRYRNLLFLSGILPKKMIIWILRRNLYYLIIPVDMRSFILAIIFAYNRILRRRKYIYPIFSIRDIVFYNLYFICRKISYKLQIAKIFKKKI